MEWLNYHHLFHFQMIAQEGSITAAALRLRLSHSTLSTQVQALEEFLGQPLFERRGRRLLLTPFGTEVAEHAADIFRLGSELVELARGRGGARHTILRVGVVGTLPRTVIYRLLESVFQVEPSVSLVVRQAPLEELLAWLVNQRSHLLLSDTPAPEALGLRVRTHLLGRSEVRLYGTPALAQRYRPGFPASLQGAPLLLPSSGCALRASLDRWFVDHDLRVEVTGEFEDSGLLRVFGAMGRGLFPIRTVLQSEVEETHHVRLVGPLDGVRERYYLIAPEQRTESPFVAAIRAAARNRLARVTEPPVSRRG